MRRSRLVQGAGSLALVAALMLPSAALAATAAPSSGLKLKATAAAIPGTTPWVKASPKKLIPRRTSQVPTTPHIRPARIPPSSARCWNA